MATNQDIEHGPPDPEFERIKENYRDTYRTTYVPPEETANATEDQAAFEELESELQAFLEQHIPRVVSLAARMGGASTSYPLTRSRTASSTMYHTAGPHSTAHHYEPSEAHGAPTDVLSDETTYHHHGTQAPPMRSRRPSTQERGPESTSRKRSPVDKHAATLQEFLHNHAENLKALQHALGSPMEQPAMVWRSLKGGQLQAPVREIQAPVAASVAGDSDEGHFEGLNQQFNMLVIISTFTAALIVSFVALIQQINGDATSKAFNAGMVFSFFGLLVHLGNTVIAGRAAAITGQQMTIKSKEYDPKYFTFYLVVCEQLQFLGALFFSISLGIMVFLIFRSIAFPLVLILFSLVGAVLVFWSTYWKVSITYKNLKFLIENYKHFKGKTVERLKAEQNGDMPVVGQQQHTEKRKRLSVFGRR